MSSAATTRRHRHKNYPLRVSDEIRDLAEDQARKRHWSLNTYYAVAIEEKLKQDLLEEKVRGAGKAGTIEAN